MGNTFKGASAFTNQDLSSWNVGNVPLGKYNYFTDSGSGNTAPTWKP
jgi:surface protein